MAAWPFGRERVLPPMCSPASSRRGSARGGPLEQLAGCSSGAARALVPCCAASRMLRRSQC
eukprot:12389435-Alexandrium_andersonii.AAC.1